MTEPDDPDDPGAPPPGPDIDAAVWRVLAQARWLATAATALLAAGCLLVLLLWWPR